MSEECDGRSNLPDSAVPTNAGQLLHDLRVRTVLRAQFSVNRARLHAIDRNSGSPQLSRESACEAVDGKFGCDIQRHAGKRCSLSEAGTDVDYPPPLLRNHPTSRVLRQRDDRPNVEVEMLVIGIFRTLHERPEDHRSCIVTRMSRRPPKEPPKAWSMDAISLFVPSMVLRSAPTASAFPPASRISLTIFSARAGLAA